MDRAPDAPALLFRGETTTYRQLDGRANRLARVLRSKGIGREDRVAVRLPRGPAWSEAILGILKAGAAYVPIDPSTPADRAAFIVEDSGAKAVIEPGAFAAETAAASDARLTREETGARPEDLAYVIYTSGTTGKPKGVMIENRSAVALVRAEAALYGVRPDDRVFQFFSPSFDASVEEFWAAFAAGAALVPAAADDLRAGPGFARALTAAGVTVLSTVPTFLMMVEDDVPGLRTLILGGEVCPPDIVGRWHRPGRRIWNTYGPTEATVVATAALLEPGRPVTIGRPIAGYRVDLLDDQGAPVAAGEAGELCISGPGVARGYLNRPELTAEKFVVRSGVADGPLRMYRTADLARWTPAGDLEYLGRADDQVKIRGYRVELAEVDAALARIPGVLAGAAVVRAGSQDLAAFVVLRAGAALDRRAAREALTAALPPYMVPAFLDEAPALPMTASGKIDRRALPAPRTPLAAAAAAGALPPRNDAERAVVAAWAAALGRPVESVRDDFFRDLAGHSLLAAHAVSRLRREPGFAGISIGDLYAHPTVEGLAALAEAASPDRAPSPFLAAGALAHRLCGAAQALAVLLVSTIYAWQWLGAFLTYGYIVVADRSIPEGLAAAFAVYLLSTPVVLGLSIALKWALLGRIRPGRHPLWGWYYFRFWLVRAVVRAAPVVYLEGTPLINAYWRLMGARVGRGVFLGNHGFAAYDLVSLGDGASVGTDVDLGGFRVEGGELRLERVSVGAGAWIGHRCALGAGAVLEVGAGLDDLSMLPDGGRVPAGELWRGSPARPAGRMPEEARRPAWSVRGTLALAAGVLSFPFVILAAVFPGLMLMVHLGHADEGFTFLVAAPFVAFSFVAMLCVEIWALKWLLLAGWRRGTLPSTVRCTGANGSSTS